MKQEAYETEMEDSAVTVLMAVYNSASYLKTSIESILNQTYENFEFLIINDCSTDRSMEIVNSFKDKRIRVYQNPKNLGQIKSLNLGLQLAHGKYIARMDADDFALPKWLETQINYIQNHPEYSVVSSYAVTVDCQNRLRKIYKPPRDIEDIVLRSLIKSPINHVGSVFSRTDILRLGGYDEQYLISSDYALWLKLIQNNFKITTTPKLLVVIREHEDSMSKSNGRQHEIKELREILSANITRYTNKKLMDDELCLFHRANYNDAALTCAEFRKATQVTREIFHNLSIPSLNRGKLRRWASRRCKIIYGKQIISVIMEQKYAEVRKLCLDAMKEVGPVSIFSVVWGVSFLGKSILSGLPRYYAQIQRLNAVIQFSIASDTCLHDTKLA